MHPDRQATVTRLFPLPAQTAPLEGLYLGHDIRAAGDTSAAFVYTNFISSLDGHISEVEPGSNRRRVPQAIANDRDWRLYMELAAQADVVLTSARHLRAIVDGRHTELVDIGHGQHADLAGWRRDRGLEAQPAIAVMSTRLELPIAALRDRLATPLLVVTTSTAPERRVAALQAEGIEVLHGGDGDSVDGHLLVQALGGCGLRCIYSIAGPRVLHTLQAAGVLNRLYLSLAHVLLGGEHYDTLTHGPAFTPPALMQLHKLYLDPTAPPGSGQLLACFETRRESQPD